MKKSSICKFIETEQTEVLTIKHFIRETDISVMQRESAFLHHRMILITGADLHFRINGAEVLLLKRGDLIFLFKGETLTVTSPTHDAEYMYVSFEGGRSEVLFNRFGINKANRLFTDNQSMIPFWQDSIIKADENADLVAESVAFYTFSRLTPSQIHIDNVVSKAIKIMEEYFSDATLNLTTLAEQTRYNHKYLSQAFKKQMGVNVSDYLRNLRIQHAAFLFDHGIESVKNVAYLSGFKDPLHFSLVFKNAIGLTPSQYKNKNKLNKTNS